MGLTQNAGVVAKMGKDFQLLFDLPESKSVLDRIAAMARAVYTRKKLGWSRIGQIGKGCPGMLDTEFHLLELQNKIGPEVVYISISEFY